MADADGHPSLAEMNLGSVLAALVDTHRRQVVIELACAPDDTERTCASFGLPISKASLTHHFRVLREAGLIRQVDHGNRRATTLRRRDLEARFPGLLALLKAEAASTLEEADASQRATRPI